MPLVGPAARFIFAIGIIPCATRGVAGIYPPLYCKSCISDSITASLETSLSATRRRRAEALPQFLQHMNSETHNIIKNNTATM